MKEEKKEGRKEERKEEEARKRQYTVYLLHNFLKSFSEKD